MNDNKVNKKEFANALIRNRGNKTQAYLEVRPFVTIRTAQNQGCLMAKHHEVRHYLKDALLRAGIIPDWIISRYKIALEAGLGKHAKNSDSLLALSDLKGLVSLE